MKTIMTDILYTESESIATILPLLANVSASLPRITKDARNDHFKYNYAELEDIQAQLKPRLLAAGIWLYQPPTAIVPVGGGVEPALLTRFIHIASGEWMATVTPLCMVKVAPQDQGSGITYARRYVVQSFLDMIVVDDDAHKAMHGSKQQGKSQGNTSSASTKGANQTKQSSANTQTAGSPGSALPPCPICLKEALAPSKKEWGGGYYCNTKKDGCGKSWKAHSWYNKDLDEESYPRREDVEMCARIEGKDKQEPPKMIELATPKQRADLKNEAVDHGWSTQHLAKHLCETYGWTTTSVDDFVHQMNEKLTAVMVRETTQWIRTNPMREEDPSPLDIAQEDSEVPY